MAQKIQVNINDERSVRLNKLIELDKKGILAYPSKSNKSSSITESLKKKDESLVTIAGRIIARREFGKLTFIHVQDESGKIQVAFKEDEIGYDLYSFFIKFLDIGDIIEIDGKRFKTHKGEDSILASNVILLSKAVRPMPDKFHGLQDEEIRLRKRYLEFISNPELKNLFYTKAKFWHATREFLINKGFIEVETPVLESTPGGADATPFITHHNALDMDVYLRISMGELWQKRLMIAGFEKTFEIGRQFRNEGMSREHLQDYSQMEFYWAYANYKDGMEMVEKLYKYVIEKSFGKKKFNIGEFKDIDIFKKWYTIDYTDEIKKQYNIDILSTSDLDLKKLLKRENIEFEKFAGKGRLIDLLWKKVRKNIKGPAFVVHHPVAVSPLAKRKKDNNQLTERYQVMIAGSELGNGYTELNDPIDQVGRFEEQSKMRDLGDNEAQMQDADFVEALEYGMPPTTGFGFSERLFSFLADRPIKECVLFPLMKPKDYDK